MQSTQPGEAIQRAKIYKLQPEDVLRIQVFNQPQVSGEFIIGEDGNVTVPFGGIVKAEGKTCAEVESELYKVFVRRLRLKDPIVSVTILKYREKVAYINGFVQKSGAYRFRPGDTVISLLSQAGGVDLTRADTRRCRFKRKGWTEEVPLDLYALQVQGDLSQNFELQDGDLIEVPELENPLVNVLGAVARPGAYPYREGMTVSDALGLAAGEIQYRSRMSKITIIRVDSRMNTKQIIPVDFVAYLRKQDYAQNVKLKAGDTIWVPTTNSPDLNQVNALINTAFILQTFGSLFGVRLIR